MELKIIPGSDDEIMTRGIFKYELKKELRRAFLEFREIMMHSFETMEERLNKRMDGLGVKIEKVDTKVTTLRKEFNNFIAGFGNGRN